MRGYSSIDNLSWEACQKLLRIEKSPERLQEIQDRLDELAKEIEGKDNSAYKACTNLTSFRFYLASYPQGLHVEEAKEKIRILEKEEENRVFKSAVTINDFNEYISKYPNGTYVREALIHVDDLFFSKNNSSKSKCKRYLAKYPNGRNVVEAKAIISRANKKRVFLVLLLIIAAIVVYLGFNPSGKIVFSELHGVGNSNNFSKGNVTILYYTPKTLTVPSIAIAKAGDSNKSLSFPKEGGSKEVVFTSGASKENIELTSSQSWISAKLSSDGKIIINVTKNEEGERTGNVEVKAYSTLFGIRTGSTTGVIYVSQASGHASFIELSSDEISFDRKSGKKNITITSDGFWNIIESAPSWGTFSINDNKITISVEENTSEDRSVSLTIKSGKCKKNINIYQKGIPATYFNLAKNEINPAIEGAGEGKWYFVNYETDGKTIKAYTDSKDAEWLKATVSKSSSLIGIDVTPNNGPRRTGVVYVEATGEPQNFKDKIRVVQKGKTTKISLDYKSWTFKQESDYGYLDIYCDGDEPIESYTYKDWITTYVTSSGQLKVSVLDNTGEYREGTVYIKSGSKETSIIIKQKGYHSCSCTNGYVWGVSGQYYDALLRVWLPTYGWVQCKTCEGKGKVKD